MLKNLDLFINNLIKNIINFKLLITRIFVSFIHKIESKISCYAFTVTNSLFQIRNSGTSTKRYFKTLFHSKSISRCLTPIELKT